MSQLTPDQQIIRELSDRIVVAQQPIRILDAVKWDPIIQHQFFAKSAKELPQIPDDYYQQRGLPYDPDSKKAEFDLIIRDIHHKLGQFSTVGNMMIRICHEYQRAVQMLEARGTPEFSKISVELYGSARDAFYLGAPSLIDMSNLLGEILNQLGQQLIYAADNKQYNGEEGVAILQQRLGDYFKVGDTSAVSVMLSDNIIADAAAGADKIKLRHDAQFSERDLRLLEVHEGWVHVGTTLNGLKQPICTFLGKGTPSATVTQEGLAVLTEIVTHSSYPARVKRICDRVTAIDMVEQGANFLEVYNYFLAQNLPTTLCYNSTMRIFRGSTPTGLPFTKDLSYAKGFMLLYNFLHLAVKYNKSDHIPTLFVGKTCIEDIKSMHDLVQEGLVLPAIFIPPQFKDLAALSAWLCFSLFMNKLNLDKFGLYFKETL